MKTSKGDRPIVFVYSAPLPGPAASSIQTMRMAAATAASGRQVLVSGSVPANMLHAEVFEYYGIPQNFTLLPSGAYRARGGLRTVSAIGSLMRRFRWRWVCHTRIASAALLTAALGIRTVFELHSIPVSPNQRRSLSFLARAPGLKRVVVISQALRDELLRKQPAFARREVVVAHDAVDPQQFYSPLSKEEARRQLGLPLDARIVGYTGRLTAGKGVHVLLEAARDGDFMVLVLGGNPTDPSDNLAKYRAEFESDRIVFRGYQPPAAIPTYLRAFDVAVAPFTNESISRMTLGDRIVPYDISNVMSPLKLFEYMASGTPFVTSDMPVLREVITPGETATVVPPGDPQALREAIDALLAAPETAQAIAEGARAAVQQHSWDARVAKLFEGIA